MGKRRKGKNIIEGNTIKGMVSAVSSDEGEADGGDMVNIETEFINFENFLGQKNQ